MQLAEILMPLTLCVRVEPEIIFAAAENFGFLFKTE
jgi:hypothetical protein